MEFFKRLNKKYYHTDPVEHIIGEQIRKLAEYDDLYENQTRFDGTIWTKFKETHKLTCQFYDDLTEIDLSNDITCLWFFRERADRSSGNDDILLKDKTITYNPNAIFITASKEIKIGKRKRFFPRRPCVQIDINNEMYLNIKKGLDINE